MQFYASDIMTRKLVTARPDMMCEEVMDLLISNRITGVPVVDEHKVLVGVISMFDIINAGLNLPYTSGYFEEAQIDRLLAEEGLHLESITEGFVSEYMIRDVFTAYPETPVEELARTMYKNRIHRVIILKPNQQVPVGIVSTFDLLKLMADGESTADIQELETPSLQQSK